MSEAIKLKLITDNPKKTSRGERNAWGKRHIPFLLAFADVRGKGLTDCELANITSKNLVNAAQRRLELERNGMIERTQNTRETVTGRKGKIWIITQLGIEKANTLKGEVS